MRKLSSRPITIVFLALCCFLTSASATTVLYQPASQCALEPWNGTREVLIRGVEGISTDTALAAGGMSITCPVRWKGTAGSMSLVGSTTIVNYLDTNGSSAGDLVCTPVGIDAYGTQYAGNSRHSCSTAGGCITSNPYFTTPTGSSTYLYLAIYGPAASFVGYGVICTVPHNMGTRSWIENYATTYF